MSRRVARSLVWWFAILIDDSVYKHRTLRPIVVAHGMKEKSQVLGNVLDVNFSLLLKFQENIVIDMVQEDGLLVLGKGLGSNSIVSNLLKVLMQSSADKRSLIMLINATPDESAIIEESMMELWWNSIENNTNGMLWKEHSPKFSSILGDAGTVDRRRKLYANGGIVSISNRVLVTDILSHVINPDIITGLVILHAENISQYSMDRFVVNLYRKENQWGFIKAISDDPEKFCKGFQPLQTRMKYFKVEKAFLWPRFHVGVTESIQRKLKNKNESQDRVTEIRIKLTPYMEKIQNSLMASMEILIAELRRNNPDVASEYWSIENALDPNFVQSIVGSLNPVWHRVSTTSKKLLSELSLVKTFVQDLYSLDAVTYYEQLKEFITEHTDVTSQKESLWLMIPEASATIACAKDRVYKRLDPSEPPTSTNLFLEELPKWEQLMVILEEINDDKLNNKGRGDGPIVIACSSRQTCRQLENVLSNFQIEETPESRAYSFRKIMKSRLEFYKWSRNSNLLLKKMNQELRKIETKKSEKDDEVVVSKTFTHNNHRNSERRRTRGGNIVAQHDRLMNFQVTSDPADEFVDDVTDYNFVDDDTKLETDEIFIDDGILTEPINLDNKTYSLIERGDELVIATFDAIELEELMPSYIICYEPDLTFIRMIELYQASLHAAKCYFMYYGESVEEQMYLNSIKYEKDAFTKLIREKANMPKFFTTEDDERSKFNESFRHLNSKTRIAGGGQIAVETHKIIVDMRDFNSQLPFVCHLAGLEVIPAMLTVGDYILTNEICIERKAVKDLIESLENGRLMKQCESMFKWYKKPALLIEFDEDKSFSFEPFTTGYLTSGNSKVVKNHKVELLQLRLAVLIRTYPRLSIIWSSSPFETARIFREIKHNQFEPDVEFALMAGTSELSALSQYNEDALKLLKLIPGISDANSVLIMSKVSNLYEFSQMSEEEMATIIGREPAKLAFKFLNKQYK